MSIQNAGTQILTATGVIGVSGKPVRIYGIQIVCGTAAVAHIHSGTAASSTAAYKETGTANTGKTISFGLPGLYFPSGAYCSFETNVSRVIASYSQDTAL